MLFVIDLDTLEVIETATDKRRVSQREASRGDDTPFEVRFVRSGIQEELATGTVLTFCAKADQKFDGVAVVLQSGFTLTGAGTSAEYTADVNLDTVPLDALLVVDGDDSNDLPHVDLMGEFSWKLGDAKPTTARRFRLRVNNDVYRGDEGTPTNLPDPAEWMPAPLVLDAEPVNYSDPAEPPIKIDVVADGSVDDFGNPANFPRLQFAGTVAGRPSYTNSGDATGGYIVDWSGTYWSARIDFDGVIFERRNAGDVASPDLLDPELWTMDVGTGEGVVTVTRPATTAAEQIGQHAQLPGDPDRWWIAETLSSWREVFIGGDLESGPVTSSGGVSAIADAALTIAKTSGLQTALDAKTSLDGSNITDTAAFRAAISATSWTAGNTLLVDSVNGNNSTAARGTTKPYLTLAAAQTAATDGDLIKVGPGTYPETLTLSKNLGWFFESGAIVQPASGSAVVVGAVTAQIAGNGQFIGLTRGVTGDGVTANFRFEAQFVTAVHLGAVSAITGGTWDFEAANIYRTSVRSNAAANVYVRGKTLGNIDGTGNGLIVESYGNIQPITQGAGIGVNLAGVPGGQTSNAIMRHHGNVVSINTDGVSARGGGSIFVWGNVIAAANDAAVFCENYSVVEVWGDVSQKTSAGWWQLCGSGAGLFNGHGPAGGKITVHGNVTGYMPIICANGRTEVWGNVTVDRHTLPAGVSYYHGYSGEPNEYGTDRDGSLFQPTDLVTSGDYVNSAINLFGIGSVHIHGDITSNYNHAINQTNGTVYVDAGRRITSAVGSAVHGEGGVLELGAGVTIASPAAETVTGSDYNISAGGNFYVSNALAAGVTKNTRGTTIAPTIIAAWDGDASAYFSLHGITSPAERERMNAFFATAKANGWWDNMLVVPLRLDQQGNKANTANFATFGGWLPTLAKSRSASPPVMVSDGAAFVAANAQMMTVAAGLSNPGGTLFALSKRTSLAAAFARPIRAMSMEIGIGSAVTNAEATLLSGTATPGRAVNVGLAADTWFSIAAVNVAATSMTRYFNGGSAITVTDTASNSADAFNIGARSSNNNHWDGKIAVAIISKSALDAAAVAALHTAAAALCNVTP